MKDLDQYVREGVPTEITFRKREYFEGREVIMK